jgi:adenine deaminase
MKAYRMAALNPAAYYRIDYLVGSVTPGKLADLLILDSLEEVRTASLDTTSRSLLTSLRSCCSDSK